MAIKLLFFIFYLGLSYATKPLFNIRLISPSQPTVNKGGTLIARYLIKNQSKANYVNSKTIANSEMITESSDSCHLPQYLAVNQSCILSLRVTNIVNSNPLNFGPEICFSNSHGDINPFFCSKPNEYLNVNMIPSPLMVNVGINNLNNSPLIVQSVDSGLNWYTPNISDDIIGGQFVFTQCYTNNYCLSVGGTPDNVTPSLTPFVYTNLGTETSWKRIEINNVPTIGNFYGTSCSDDLSTCIAVGYRYVSSSLLTPLLVQTIDNGQNWSTQSISGLNETFAGTFIKSTCYENWCLAVGQTVSNGDLSSTSNSPLLTQTTNSGSTWSLVTATQSPASGYLYEVSCTSMNGNPYCVSVGQNYNNSSFLIMDSRNHGNTWNTNQAVYALGTGELNDVKCISNACFAIGALHGSGTPPTTIYTPTMIKTTDNGNTWTLVNILNKPTNANFYYLSCSQGATPACIAVGVNYANNLPMIAQSFDGGSHWSMAQLDQSGEAILNAGGCSGSGDSAICFASGQTMSGNTLILRTSNAGKDWNDCAGNTNNLGAFYASASAN